MEFYGPMQSLDNGVPDPVIGGTGTAPLRAAVAPPPAPLSVIDLHRSADRLVLRLTSSEGSVAGGSIELPLSASALTAVTIALCASDDAQDALLRRALREGPRHADDPATRLALAELPLFLAAPGAPDPDIPAAHAAHAADIVNRAVARLLLVSAGSDLAAVERRDGRVTVDRACGFMSREIARSLTLDDVVRATDASSRALQYGFRARHGLSPMRWLREQRLRRLHAALRAAPTDEGVAELATALGLNHLGRLGQVFEARFGLLPRALLHRARLG